MHKVSVMKKKKKGEGEKNYSPETHEYWFTVLRKEIGGETAEEQCYRKGLGFRNLTVFINWTSGDTELTYNLPFSVLHQAWPNYSNSINSKQVIK